MTVGLGLVAVAIVLLFWWRSGDDAPASVRRDGVIRIGYAVEAPYAFLTPDGKVTGESPEIARVIAARLGIPRVEWRLAEFDSLIEGLEARRFDVIAAGMFITPARAGEVAFSSPTFQVRPGLLVRKGNPRRLHSYADIVKDAGARIAVLTGSVAERWLRHCGFPAAQLVQVPDAQAGCALVRDAQADGLVLSAPTIRWMAIQNDHGQTEMAEPFGDTNSAFAPAPGLGAFAFRKGNRSLRKAWNAELKKLIGSDEHRRLISGFGFSPAEMPGRAPDNPSVPTP